MNIDYKIYKVIWIDSSQSHGWILKDDLKEFDMGIVSCGFLIRETESFIVLSSHIGEDCICSPMQIPKIAITSMEEIKNAIS